MKLLLLSVLLCLGLPACREQPATTADGQTIEIVDTFDPSDSAKRDENHPDFKLIRQLEEAGSNLSKPHHPDFQFDFQTRRDASKVADLLEKEGFSCEIQTVSETPRLYELIAQKTMRIEFEAMADLTDHLGQIARQHQGELTGWGTPIED